MSDAQKIRHEWYQNDNEVVISVFIKNVQPDALTVDIQPRSLSLNIKLLSGSEIAFDLDPLARTIDPPASSYKVMSTKIEIKLCKMNPGAKWIKIEGDEESNSIQTINAATEKGHGYPSSSRHRKDWDALAREVKQEEEKAPESKDPNAGGDGELQKVFQKLYAGATDEQRMAMKKSYQESNGTALSTNWDDVKKGTVETKPPESMIAKKWEQ